MLALLLVVLLVGLTAVSARARPLGYGSASCNPAGVDVCHWIGSAGRWVCDLSNLGVTTGGQAWMIYGEGTERGAECGNVCDGNLYCAFGQADGVAFYCDLTQPIGQYLADGWLLGTDQADTLSFWYEEGATLQCDMKHHGFNTSTIPLVIGRSVGNSGADTIHGSREVLADYMDDLSGDAGDDFIYAHQGADLVHGGAGSDTIHGGADDDEIYGNDGFDYISAGAGADAVFGGNQSDFICGDGDDDTLYGGGHYDYLWGGDGTDHLDGQGTGALCYDDGVDTLVNCDRWWTMPTVCPDDVLLY